MGIGMGRASDLLSTVSRRRLQTGMPGNVPPKRTAFGTIAEEYQRARQATGYISTILCMT